MTTQAQSDAEFKSGKATYFTTLLTYLNTTLTLQNNFVSSNVEAVLSGSGLGLAPFGLEVPRFLKNQQLDVP